MEALIPLVIEVLKFVGPLVGAWVVFKFTQRRAKSLGIDEAAKEYESIRDRLKTALQDDLKETREDFLGCKQRLVEAEKTIEELRLQISDQDQIIFNLRLDISALQKIGPRNTRRKDIDGTVS